MAIQNLKEKMTLRLELDGGIVNGKQKTIPKSFSQIKTTAEDTALYSTAETLASLQDKGLIKVKRMEITSLWSD